MKSARLLPRLLVGACLAALPLHAQNAPVQSTVIESAGTMEMVSSDTETTITCRDKVVVTGTNLRLTCDYLQVVVLRKGDATATLGSLDKLRSLVATGNVHIVQGDREAACGRAELQPGDDKIVLTGNPVIAFHDQEGRLAGEKITMFRGECRVLVEKPVGTLPPIKDLGFDKDKKEEPPAGAARQP